MTIGTDLTSVSTQGWYTDPVLTDTLTPISTFGWYYEDAGVISVLFDYKIPVENISLLEEQNNIPIEFISDASVIISPEIPIENIASILEENNIPIEIQSDIVLITTDKNIPIEIIAGIISDNELPIEVFRTLDESIWRLNRRGILWEMENCGFIWIRKDKR